MFSWLLISKVADLLNSLILSRTEPQKKKISLSKFSPQVKAFAVLMCINTNLELLQIGCNQARYVSGGTCLE